MEFCLISSQAVTFAPVAGCDQLRRANANLENVEKIHEQVVSNTTRRLHSKPESDKSVEVLVGKYRSPENHPYIDVYGYLNVPLNNSNKNCFWRLNECLGKPLVLNIELELGTKDNFMTVKVNDFEVPVSKGDSNNQVTMMNAGFSNFNFTRPLAKKWKDDSSVFTGKLTVYLKLSDNHFSIMTEPKTFPDPLCLNKRIQMDTFSADALIIPGNGDGIKCHKVFLTAHSDVLKAMFEASMKEGTTSTVEMPDMSSSGIHALMDFLYCFETNKAIYSCEVTMELLVMADRYSIKNLETEMLRLICANGNKWFSISVALRLFLFARKKFENEGFLKYRLLERKTANVLKSKTRVELEQCQDYKDLFKDPKTGMEVCTYFMTRKER